LCDVAIVQEKLDGHHAIVTITKNQELGYSVQITTRNGNVPTSVPEKQQQAAMQIAHAFETKHPTLSAAVLCGEMVFFDATNSHWSPTEHKGKGMPGNVNCRLYLFDAPYVALDARILVTSATPFYKRLELLEAVSAEIFVCRRVDIPNAEMLDNLIRPKSKPFTGELEGYIVRHPNSHYVQYKHVPPFYNAANTVPAQDWVRGAGFWKIKTVNQTLQNAAALCVDIELCPITPIKAYLQFIRAERTKGAGSAIDPAKKNVPVLGNAKQFNLGRGPKTGNQDPKLSRNKFVDLTTCKNGENIEIESEPFLGIQDKYVYKYKVSSFTDHALVTQCGFHDVSARSTTK
jgi:hypothetical protein